MTEVDRLNATIEKLRELLHYACNELEERGSTEVVANILREYL